MGYYFRVDLLFIFLIYPAAFVRQDTIHEMLKKLNVHFRDLVRGARALGVRVIDRCNLTILSEPGQDGLGEKVGKGQGVFQ